jgi:hypothetical protein
VAELARTRNFGLWPRMFVVLVTGGALASLAAMLSGDTPAQLNTFAPFGLCAGLNVFCGMAIANGSLVLLLVAHLIHLPEWQQIRRASLVLAASGYTVAMVAMLSGLPLSHQPWPAVIQIWQPTSILYGALWTPLLLCALGLLEFLPALFPELDTRPSFSIARRLELPLVILALIAATVQQIGLSRAVTAADARMSPLWTGPDLSVMFFLSSVCGALALLLFALWRGSLAFHRRVPVSLMSHMARVLGVALFIYLAVRVTGLLQRGFAPIMFAPSKDSALFLLEISAFVLGMMWVGAGETSPQNIQAGALMVICGVMLNRLNTSITALEGTVGPYRPHVIELLISFSLVAVGIAGFGFCARHLPVFAEGTQIHS